MSEYQAEKAAAAQQDAFARYPPPAEPAPNNYEAPVAYPQPVSMSDAPVATTIAVGPPSEQPAKAAVASPNKYVDWLTSGGATKGLCIGYGILSFLSFLVMCIAGSANNASYATMGWQIFNGLQGWLYAAALATMFGWRRAHETVMQVWKSVSPNIVQWVWISVNAVEVIWWIAAMGNISAWNWCTGSTSYWWNDFYGGSCSKVSAVLAFDVFCFLGWLWSLTFALLEKFAPKYVGTIGWKEAAPAVAAEVKAVPVAMATLESAAPVEQV